MLKKYSNHHSVLCRNGYKKAPRGEGRRRNEVVSADKWKEQCQADGYWDFEFFVWRRIRGAERNMFIQA